MISVYTTVFVGSTPIGGLLMGALASTYGVDLSLAVAGIGCLATGALSLVWLRRIRGAALFRPTTLAPVPAETQARSTCASAARPPSGPARPSALRVRLHDHRQRRSAATS